MSLAVHLLTPQRHERCELAVPVPDNATFEKATYNRSVSAQINESDTRDEVVDKKTGDRVLNLPVPRVGVPSEFRRKVGA